MTFVSVSLALGMYLFAYNPAEAPPASNPPGLKMRAASPAPPVPPNDGIWNLVDAFCRSRFSLKPTALGFTFDGFANTLGKPMKVYAKTVSFVIVGLNT